MDDTSTPAANVVSVRGGKVHTAMPGLGDDAYPLCRGGGMNNRLTCFTTTHLPITCAICLGYEEARTKRELLRKASQSKQDQPAYLRTRSGRTLHLPAEEPTGERGRTRCGREGYRAQAAGEDEPVCKRCTRDRAVRPAPQPPAAGSEPAVIEGAIVSHKGTAKGSLPKHAADPDVRAALDALTPLRLAALADDYDDEEADPSIGGVMVEPRGNGRVAAYWLVGGQHRTPDREPWHVELDIIRRKFAEAGWTVEPQSLWCVFAWRPGTTEGPAPVRVRMYPEPGAMERLKRQAEADRAAWRAKAEARRAAAAERFGRA